MSDAARHHRLSDAHAEAWIASHNRPPTRDKVSSALRVLDDAIAEWQPETVYALFSGGGDSIVAAHIASRHPRFNGCVFIDTGTALPGVRRDNIERYGQDLWAIYHWIVRAQDGKTHGVYALAQWLEDWGVPDNTTQSGEYEEVFHARRS